jgi:pyruvate formate lyase activating enzyme
MLINLGGINENPSTVDWHGKCCVTIFLRGCPLLCPWCHNRSIREGSEPTEIYSIVKKISKSKDFISGVVISGGECTFQPTALEELAVEIKNMRKLVGIQTAGVFPEVLKKMLKNELIDKVFLDVKHELRFDKYLSCVGLPLKLSSYSNIHSRVLESLQACDDLAPDYEIRTTIFPSGPTLESLEHIYVDLENNVSKPIIWRLQPGLIPNEQVDMIKKKRELNKIAMNLRQFINSKHISVVV